MLQPAAATERTQPTRCIYIDPQTNASGAAEDIYRLRIAATWRTVHHRISRCGIADLAASLLTALGLPQRPTTIDVLGNRWSVGIYRCTVRITPVKRRDEVDQHITCAHIGAYANTVTFDSYA